ncbi:EAL domain-containing protein [Magnetospira thiophila]
MVEANGHAATALDRSEARYRFLVEKSISFLCTCEDGVITYLNPAGRRLVGSAESLEIIGSPFAEILHPDYRLLVAENLSELAGEGDVVPMKFLDRQGQTLDVEVAVVSMGQPGAYVVQARDITSRLRAAERLREREESLRGIVDTVAEGIITTNATGQIRGFNKAAEVIFGYSSYQVMGQNVSLLMDSGHGKRHQDFMQDYISEKGRRPLRTAARLLKGRRRDGSLFPLEIALSALHRGREALFTAVVRDVTERLQADESLRQAQAELEHRVDERTRALTQEVAERRRIEESLRLTARVLEATSEGVVLTDPEFRVTSVNPAFTRITGFTAEESLGKRPRFHTKLKRDKALYAEMLDSIAQHDHWEGEIWNKRKNGERYAQRLSISTIHSDEGDIHQYAVLISDITRRKEDEERILYQANFDALTGLPNRASFMERLDQSLQLGKRQRRKVVLMFIDLDGFKLVNDTLGHEMGDLLLTQAASRLLDCVRTSDTVARLGGDEFTICLTEISDEYDTPIVAQRVIDALSRAFDLNGQEAFVSASVGITTFPDDADNATDLLKNADGAMYRAKEKGKDNYQFFTADMNEEVKERLFLKNGLANALERQEFVLYYQPKMGLQVEGMTGVEALMRWNHPEIGLVPPGRFIPVLEETGLVVDVGIWILREACRQHLEWIKQGLPPIRIAVNLSARQLRDTALIGIFEEIFKDTGLGPDALEVEITESMLMSDHGPVIKVLEALHEMGLKVAMDDFGTGYSSLSYLKRFPIDIIKIDRSFVSDIAIDSDDAEIIRTIINMAQSLRRKVVAEGVEDAEQLRILRDYKCHEVQGYFFSPPMPALKMKDYLLTLESPKKQ